MTDQTGSGGAWHPDPLNRYSQRWWDGSAWTDQVVDATGATITDPMGIAAAPAVDATIVDPVAEVGTTTVFGAPPPPGAVAAGTAVPGGMGGTPTTPAAGYAPAPAAGSGTSNGLAIAALILGIVGFFCVPPLALGAVVCGFLGLSAAKKTGVGKGMSIAGLILGLVGVVLWIVVFFALVVLGHTANNINDTYHSDPSNGVCNQNRIWEDPDC